VRWDLTFGRNITWNYPSASIYFTNASEETRLTDCGDFIASKWVMSWIYYTLLKFYNWTRQVKAITSVLHGCQLSFKFICEVSINKTEIHYLQLHVRNLIQQLAIPLCINPWIWSYKFYCGIQIFFVKRSSNASIWLWRTKNSPPFELASSVFPKKEIFPADAAIFSLAETWTLPSPVGRISLFKRQSLTNKRRGGDQSFRKCCTWGNFDSFIPELNRCS
jgi:hypothetical protein